MFGSAPKTKATQQPILQGIRVSSSLYGTAVPQIYGTQRVPGLLLDYTDFQAIPATSQQSAGGKGFGGGSKNDSTSYDYKAAVVLGLCVGPVAGLANVWDSKGVLALSSVSETHTVPTGGGTIGVANAGANYHRDLGVTRALAYSYAIDDFGDPLGARTLAGTHNQPLQPTEYSSDGAGNYTFTPADSGKSVTITYTYSIPDTTDSGKPAQVLSLTLFNGAQGQTPWSYMTSRHPDRALSYSYIAYVANSAMDLGSGADLPNYTYEVTGLFPFGGGIIDANPSDVITDWISHPFRGAGRPDLLGNLTQYSNYCIALGLFVSPVLDSQQSLLQWTQDLLDATNSAPLWSDGVLKVVPYGDSSAAGNGALYTPNTTPVVDLDDDDFTVSSSDEEPLEVDRTSSAEAKNRIVIEWVNRSNAYNTEPLTEDDKAAIEMYGLLADDSQQRHMLTTLAAAQTSANLALQRSVYQRAQFKFKLDERYVFLEPLDIVTLTDSDLGLNKLPVRLLEISEDEEGELSMTAEEWLFGTASATAYPKQVGAGTASSALADPGNVNSPILFEAPDALSRTGSYELWVGLSGANANWGGADVWSSPDGTTYRKVGRQSGNARVGQLNQPFPAGAAHDTVNTLEVGLAESGGQLFSGTDADRDAGRTLCWIGTVGGAFELISYKTATLVSGNLYRLTDINRGLYGTAILSHIATERFLRLDDAVLVLEFDALDVGTTASFKFPSFNTFGNKLQDLSLVSPWTYDVAGLFNNFTQVISNNAKITATLDAGGTTATVISEGPTAGSNITAKKADGASRTIARTTFPGQALLTYFWVMYNPLSNTSYLVSTRSARDIAVYNGHIALGDPVLTPNSGGTGGSTGGGGGSTGGSGGGNRTGAGGDLPL